MTQSVGNPWERYQHQVIGPWTKYQRQEEEPEPTLSGKQLQEFIRTPLDALVGDVSPQIDTNGFPDRLPPQQLAVRDPEQNPLRAGTRFGKQLYNFLIADVIDTATNLPGNIKRRLLTSIEIKSQRPELSIFEIYDSVSKAPRTKREEAERRAKSSIAIPVSPAEGLAEKALDTTAGVIAFVGQLAILKKVSPAVLSKMNPIAQNAVLFEAQNIATGGPLGEGAKMGASLGVISKLPLGRGKIGGTARTGLESGTFLGLAIEAGASEEDKLIAMFLPVGFRVYGGLSRSFKKQWIAAKTPESKGKVLESLTDAVDKTERVEGQELTSKQKAAEVAQFEDHMKAVLRDAARIRAATLKTEIEIRKEPLVVKPTAEPKVIKITPLAELKPMKEHLEPTRATEEAQPQVEVSKAGRVSAEQQGKPVDTVAEAKAGARVAQRKGEGEEEITVKRKGKLLVPFEKNYYPIHTAKPGELEPGMVVVHGVGGNFGVVVRSRGQGNIVEILWRKGGTTEENVGILSVLEGIQVDPTQFGKAKLRPAAEKPEVSKVEPSEIKVKVGDRVIAEVVKGAPRPGKVVAFGARSKPVVEFDEPQLGAKTALAKVVEIVQPKAKITPQKLEPKPLGETIPSLFSPNERAVHNKRGPGMVVSLERLAKRKGAPGFRSPRYHFKPDATGVEVVVQGSSLRPEGTTLTQTNLKQLKAIKPKEISLTSLEGKGTTEQRTASLVRKIEPEILPLEEVLEKQKQTDSIGRAIDKLSGVERSIIENEFGFRKARGDKKETDTELAKRLGITEDQVVTTRNTALDKIQKSIPRPESRRGHAAFISEVGFEITELVGSVSGTIGRTGRAIPEFLSRNIRRATGRMRKLGEHGKKIADDIDDITFKSQKRYNNDELDIRKAFRGMSLQSRENAAKLRNERITLKEVPVGNRKRVSQAANDLLEIFDRALHAWAAAGGRRLVKGKLRAPTGRGKAFPQVLNKYGRESIDALQADKLAPKTIEEINSMIEKGIYKDYETAVRRIKVFKDRVLRGVNGYLERTRIELPEEWVEWDPLKVAPMLLRRNWLVVHGTEKWGFRSAGSQFPFPKAEVSIREIEKTHPDDAMRIREFIQASFGVKYTATQRSRDVAENIRGAQFITKIALSPLTIARNMIDRYAKGLTIAPLSVNVRATLKYPPFLNVWIKSARKIEEDMFRAGAVFGHGSIAEGVEPGRIVTSAIGRPFSVSEQGNQTYLALVSSMRMQRDIKRYFQDQGTDNRLGRLLQSLVSLADESPPSVRRRLKDHKLLDLSNEDLVKILESGKVAPVELHAALHRASRDLTFPVIMSTKRMWWDNHPWVRVMAQFKTWPAEQVGFIWKSTVQEAAKGNVLPMMRFITAVTIAGEVYNIMRDALYGRDEALVTKLLSGQKLSKGEIARVLVNDAIDGGLIGMIADMTWGLTNWLFGPTGATLRDVGHAMQDSVQRPSLTGQTLKEFMTKQLPLTRQIKGTYNLIQSQNDETIKSLRQYQEWRSRAFEWKIAQEKVTVADHVREPVLGFLRGRKSFRRGKDTLAYELAADQITNSDVEAASEYLGIVLRDTRLKDRLNKVEGIRGSMRANSPLGPVKASDMGLFLDQFTPQEQFNAQLLNFQWLQRYEQALALARVNNPPKIIE